MTLVHRVLYPRTIESLDEYVTRRGGRGLEAIGAVDPETIIAEVEASGLRGRGGAGFPTGTKWRTVYENASSTTPATVVVNSAEGEPGTFKDRSILRVNPYQVIEGALIAARAIGADQVIFGMKTAFGREVGRVRSALEEVIAAGWAEGVDLVVFEGPHEYLYGEETALLETIDGRYPFPRLAPPFRRGVREVFSTDDDADAGSGLSAHVHMAGPGSATAAAPTLVDNVETLANVAHILARGADWFRLQGTPESPGTIVCTVTGSTVRAGVGEVQMGTPLREVIEAIGGGARSGRTITAVLAGVSNAVITPDMLDAPVSFEGLAGVGSGLGSAGFIVFDDNDDPISVAAGVSRFLSVESCGQCSPCKQDGITITGILEKLCAGPVSDKEWALLDRRLDTVADGARCYLATQHQTVVRSVLDAFPEVADDRRRGTVPPVEPMLVAELVDIDEHGATVDERHRTKQPDWSHDDTYSGQAPAERYTEHRAHRELDE